MTTATTPETGMTPTTDPPLLIDIHTLAALLGRSVPSLERDQAAGRLPAPVRLGGSRKWRRADIDGWVTAGCPPRAEWDARTAAR